ncbi:MAG TPA: LptA/OstA family protein, partial [Thermoanaerobaculia bacterium]|nr:LptA/OstA family protein [Thermoanaerobaculia bacterium]
MRGTKRVPKVLRRNDMQRTVKVLRVALPILIVAFIVVLALSWNRNTITGGRTKNEPVTSTQRPEDKARAEGMAFDDVQTIGGRVVSRIRARRVVSFESGWSTLEEAYLTIYRSNGLTYEISCPQAQFHAETKEAEAKGGVSVSSSDGIEIKTAEIRFDGNRLTNDIPVQFKIDRWNGNAGALDLDVAGETLRLHKRVTAVMAPTNPAEVPMTLNGDQSIFHRRENTVTFEKNVTMDRGPENVRTDFVIGRFTPDRKNITALEGNGNTVIVMAGNTVPGENLGGRKEITCEGFFTEVGAGGEITAINARSDTRPARAILEGPPRRDITARGFRVALANRAVTEIKADWQVVMKELGEVTREINAEHVTVYFDPGTRKARSAYLEGNFRYTDPKTTASAFRANYDIAGDRIVLTTDPGWQATVVSDGHTLKAKQIEFSPRAQTAKATGSVIAQLAQKGKGSVSADATTLFPSGQPVFVNADELLMRQANRTALFTGNVKAWQGTNTILTNELQVTGQGDGVTARGNVRTLLYNSAEPQRRTPVQSTSDQLIARKVDRRIDLVGKVTIIDEARRLESEKASFFFNDAQKIQRIEAENNVRMNEIPTQRKGQGDKAIYNVDKKMVYLHGSPATVTDPKGTLTGQQIQ